MYTTSLSLIEGLRSPANSDAWERFVDLYTPLFYRWARLGGMQADDAADLVQDVFALLLRKMPAYRLGTSGSFRGWLRTVMSNLRRDRARSVATRQLPTAGERVAEICVDDPAELAQDEEHRNYLVSRALQLMQADFEPATWQAVWQHCVDGRPAAEIAAELGMTTAAVYCAKFRVLGRLRRDLRGLVD